MSTDAMPTLDISLLPDDPAVLKPMIMQLIDELHKARTSLERQEHHMDLLLRRLYGSSSEKFIDPRQGTLFDLHGDGEAADGAGVSQSTPAEVAKKEKRAPRRDPHGRSRIPENIRRVEVFHKVTEAEIAAMGGPDNVVYLPPETSEQLDCLPSSLIVTVHIREKIARKTPLLETGPITSCSTPAEQNVIVASKPPEAIPGALAGPGLMAQVIVSKGTDHLPLNRQTNIWKRQGVDLSRQTMTDWWLRTAEFLKPLYQLAARVVLASHVIHTDDTPVDMHDAQKKLKQKTHFWPYVGDARHPLTVFDFTLTHQRAGPDAFLKNYRGYLQADAFNGYDGIYLNSQGRIIEVACWAHARRKYFESRHLDVARMQAALAWIAQLYAVEKDLRERCRSDREKRDGDSEHFGEWRHLDLDKRAELIVIERQQRSKPVLNSFHDWLQTEAPKVLPKSPVRGAMEYSLSNWAALMVYLEDGWLDIDNNEGENSLRGLCLGRRNWLHIGNERGGRAAAVHFSLLASCKRHGHDPWVYYKDVLTRLPAILPTLVNAAITVADNPLARLPLLLPTDIAKQSADGLTLPPDSPMLPTANDEKLLPLLPNFWKPS